jgi:hypothetical protein
MAMSLRDGLRGIGYERGRTVALQVEFRHRGPRSLRSAVIGMSDPGMASWRFVGVAFSEGSTFASSAQGVASDGRQWLVVSNRGEDSNDDTRRVGVYDEGGHRLRQISPTEEIWANLVDLNEHWDGEDKVHVGPPAWVAGVLLVPVQQPDGVWVLTDSLQHQDWWPDPHPLKPKRYSWIAHDPGTGLLYTSVYDNPTVLEALEWATLQRRPEFNIELGPGPPPELVVSNDLPPTIETVPQDVDQVQGAVFTAHGRVLLACNGPKAVYCYSALNGHYFGRMMLSGYHEVEGLTLQAATVDGTPTSVHVLDEGTDFGPLHSFDVNSYAVPRPDGL